jgi:hypothetical protein
MRSTTYISPINVSGLIGKKISLINPIGVRQLFQITSLVFDLEMDLYNGETLDGGYFSLSREKMKQIFPKIK